MVKGIASGLYPGKSNFKKCNKAFSIEEAYAANCIFTKVKKGQKYFETKIALIVCVALMIALVEAIVLTATGKIQLF